MPIKAALKTITKKIKILSIKNGDLAEYRQVS